MCLPSNDQNLPGNFVFQYSPLQRRPKSLVVLVGVLLVWDPGIQRNCSLRLIV